MPIGCEWLRQNLSDMLGSLVPKGEAVAIGRRSYRAPVSGVGYISEYLEVARVSCGWIIRDEWLTPPSALVPFAVRTPLGREGLVFLAGVVSGGRGK
jgi:hypothetical protein